MNAKYARMDVGLFFYGNGKSPWNALTSKNMGIDTREAFRLYSRRWAIEVVHKEIKGLLNLGKCQCIDIAGQIAAMSLGMIAVQHPRMREAVRCI